MLGRRSMLTMICGGALALACGSDDSGKNEFDAGTSGGSGGTAGSAGSGGAITGGTGGGSAGQAGAAGAASCGDFGQDQACKDCLKTNCCSEGGNCDKNTDCKGMVECARKCPDPTDVNSTCMQQCITDHNGGGSFYNPIILCQSNSCSQCNFI